MISSEVGLRHSNVLGVRFVAESFPAVRDAIRSLLAQEDRTAACLCPTGAHGVVEARKDPRLRRFLNSVAFNLPDGMPIVFCNRLLGFSSSERMFGPDVMWTVLGDTATAGLRHFFYGGKPGVADKLAARLQAHFPMLTVAGTYCPPFRSLSPSEEDEVAKLINESRTDIVWVGLSTPKQERWAAAMRDRLRVKLICSVGAAFDYHTGALQPAPAWMQRSALEWLYRLAHEPRRLYKRYAEIVPKFLVLSSLQLMGLRTFPLEE